MFDFCDAERVLLVPLGAATIAGGGVVEIVFPGLDVFEGAPVGDGDADAGAGRVDAKEAGLEGSEGDHVFGGLLVVGEVGVLDGGEDDGVVGRIE